MTLAGYCCAATPDAPNNTRQTALRKSLVMATSRERSLARSSLIPALVARQAPAGLGDGGLDDRGVDQLVVARLFLRLDRAELDLAVDRPLDHLLRQAVVYRPGADLGQDVVRLADHVGLLLGVF